MTDSKAPCHTVGTGLSLPAKPSARCGAARGGQVAQAGLRSVEIFRDYFDFVWSGLRRLGVPDSSVDDAVQDVFLVVHRRGGEFEGRSSLRTWVFGIVLRVARDHRRRHRRVGEAMPETVADLKPGPDDAAERSEALRLLMRLLGELDEEKRDVLVLADLEQLTAREIAEIVDVPLNTVYSRLRVARAQFNEAVARHLREQR